MTTLVFVQMPPEDAFSLEMKSNLVGPFIDQRRLKLYVDENTAASQSVSRFFVCLGLSFSQLSVNQRSHCSP